MIKSFLQKIKSLSNKVNSKVIAVILFLLVFGTYMMLSRFLGMLSTEVILISAIILSSLFCILYLKEADPKRRWSRKVFNFSFLVLASLSSLFIIGEKLNWFGFLGKFLLFPLVFIFIAFTIIYIVWSLQFSFKKRFKIPIKPSNVSSFSALYLMSFMVIYFAITNVMANRGFFISKFLFFCAPLFLIGFFAICSSRFRDLNQSMWYCLGLLVPVYNIYLLYRLIFVRGTKEENQYGPDPLEKPAIVQLL